MSSTPITASTELKGGARIYDLTQLAPFIGKDVAFTLVDDVNRGELCLGRLTENRIGSYTINLYLAPGAGDGSKGVDNLNEQRLVLREATPGEISGLRLSYGKSS